MPVRLWSPLAVALYGLLLGFPSAVVPAVRNWEALGRKKQAAWFLAAALGLTMFLVVVRAILPRGVGRFLMIILNCATFIYVKAKLQSDIADLQAAQPDVVIQYRSWYSAFGWALLGLIAIIFLAVLVTMPVVLAIARALTA